jgi:HAD superfamily hydrolase (TIGR01509 family)
MITVLLFDFSQVLLFAKDKTYQGDLNPLHSQLSQKPSYSFLDNFVLNTEILDFLKKLKNKYKLAIFTSGSIQNAPEIKLILDEIFENIFSAGKLGILKKDPQAYVQIVNLLKVEPEEILFIDDMKSNCDAAQKAGLKTHHYIDNQELVKFIEKL